jgi:hypothetical protein
MNGHTISSTLPLLISPAVFFSRRALFPLFPCYNNWGTSIKPGAEVPGAVTAGRAERILFIYFSQWALSPYVVFSRFFWFILPKKSLLAIFLKTPPGTLYSMQKKLRSGINPPAIEAWHTETLRLNEEKIKTLVKCQRCGYNYT